MATSVALESVSDRYRPGMALDVTPRNLRRRCNPPNWHLTLVKSADSPKQTKKEKNKKQKKHSKNGGMWIRFKKLKQMMESWDEGDDRSREGEVADHCSDHGLSCWNVNGTSDDAWSSRLSRLSGFLSRRSSFDTSLTAFADAQHSGEDHLQSSDQFAWPFDVRLSHCTQIDHDGDSAVVKIFDKPSLGA